MRGGLAPIVTDNESVSPPVLGYVETSDGCPTTVALPTAVTAGTTAGGKNIVTQANLTAATYAALGPGHRLRLREYVLELQHALRVVVAERKPDRGTAGETVSAGLLIASSLLDLLAIASLAVIVGGRLAERTRRVGLLKAVGATPRLVAGVLLLEYLTLALVGAAVGLAAGYFAAPLVANPGAGLIGSVGAASVSWADVGFVVALVVALAMLAAWVPSIRAARTSTTSALADSPRSEAPASPRRRRRSPAGAVAARAPAGRPQATSHAVDPRERGHRDDDDRGSAVGPRPRGSGTERLPEQFSIPVQPQHGEHRCHLARHHGGPRPPGRGERARHHLGNVGGLPKAARGRSCARCHDGAAERRVVDCTPHPRGPGRHRGHPG